MVRLRFRISIGAIFKLVSTWGFVVTRLGSVSPTAVKLRWWHEVWAHRLLRRNMLCDRSLFWLGFPSRDFRPGSILVKEHAFREQARSRAAVHRRVRAPIVSGEVILCHHHDSSQDRKGASLENDAGVHIELARKMRREGYDNYCPFLHIS